MTRKTIRTIDKPTPAMIAMVRDALPALRPWMAFYLERNIPAEDIHFIVAKATPSVAPLFAGSQDWFPPGSPPSRHGDLIAMGLMREVLTRLCVAFGKVEVPIYSALARARPDRYGNDAKIAVYDGKVQFAGYIERDLALAVRVELEGSASNTMLADRLDEILSKNLAQFRAAAVEDIKTVPLTDLCFQVIVKASKDNSRAISPSEMDRASQCVLDIRTNTRQRVAQYMRTIGGDRYADQLNSPNHDGCFRIFFHAFGVTVGYEIPIIPPNTIDQPG